MEKREMTGGCQCGRVRYRAQVDPEQAYLCHCRMCQRATGGVAAAFVNLPRDAVVWESGPDWYASSPIARRPFCSHCGSPLGFQFLEGENMDLTVGSFDESYAFAPHWHFSAETIHEDWRTDVGDPLRDRFGGLFPFLRPAKTGGGQDEKA